MKGSGVCRPECCADHADRSDGRRCGKYDGTKREGRVCTRPAAHCGPCVDRFHV